MPGGFTDADPGDGAPRPPAWRTHLGGVYPNPMNPTTRISYTNGHAGVPVCIAIYDVTGRLVRTLLDAKPPVGAHEVTWDGRDDTGQGLGSGMYFVRLTSRETIETRKVLIAK
jgi:hypothetical protein